MCKSGGQNTTTTQSQPPAWLTNELQSLGSAAQQTATQPLQQYSGSMVAGFTPDQLQAMSTISNTQGIAQPFINSGAQYLGAAAGTNLQGTAQPYLDQARGLYANAGNTNISGVVNPYLQSATSAVNPANISQFESPYTRDVVNATQAEFNNQNAQQQQGVISNAINAGAFGGDRASVAQGITAGQQALAQAPVIAGLENAGYTNAQQAAAANAGINLSAGQQAAGAAATGAGLGLQAGQGITGLGNTALGANEAQGWLNSSVGTNLAGLGAASQNAALTGASAQLQSGALQQQLGQEQLNIPYEQFLQQQAYPYQNLGWLAGIEEGAAGSSGGTSSTTSPSPSMLSQLGGLGLTGLGVIGGTGGFGSSGWLTGLLGLKAGGKVPHRDTGGLIPHLSDGGSGGIVLPSIPQISVNGYLPQSSGVVGHGRGIPSAPPPVSPANPLASAEKVAGIIGKNSSMTSPHNKPWLVNNGTQSIEGANLAADQAAVAPDAYSPTAAPVSVTVEDLPPMRRGGIIPHRAPGGTITPDEIGQITNDYVQDVGRNPESAGLQYYENLLGSGTSLGQIGDYIHASPEAQQYRKTFGNPNIQNISTIGGGIIPQVKQSVFNTPSANVTALNGGQYINALPQIQATGTTGSISFPHTTYANPLAGYFGGSSSGTSGATINAKEGGVIPFPAHRIKHRDDGGDVGDQGVTGNVISPSNWRQSSLTDAPAYQPMDTSAVKDQIQNPHVDPWMALAHAGLAMMAGTSPFALTNVGKGLESGLNEYQGEKQQAQQAAKTGFDIDQRAKDMADRAEQWRQQSAVQKESAAEAVARDAATAANQQGQLTEQQKRDAATAAYNQGMLKVQQRNAAVAEQNAGTSYQYQPGVSIDQGTGKSVEGAWKIGDDGSREFQPGMIITKPGNGQTSPLGEVNTAGQTGPALLQSLPPEVSATVKQMIEGRAPAPTGAALRSPDVMKLVQIANQVDPNFDASAWQQRYKTRQSFSGNGIDAQTTGAGVQLMNHLDKLDKAFTDLHNVDLGPASSIVNTPINWAEQSSNPAINRVGLATQAVATEAGKLWRGTGVMSEKEIQDWKNNLPLNAAPDVQHSAPKDLIELADGRFDAIRNKWQTAMGQNVPMPPLFTQSTQEKYDRLSQGQGRYTSQQIPTDPNGKVDTMSLTPGNVYRTKKGYAEWTGDTFQPLNQ